MRLVGFFALGMLVMLVCRLGFGMDFWPSLFACVLSSLAVSCLMDVRR